ncbi:hypothetical protein ACLDYA_18945, partial [Acinetobacter baumannii]
FIDRSIMVTIRSPFKTLVSLTIQVVQRFYLTYSVHTQLLGDKLMARSFPSQVNEIHARVAVLNRFTELGRPLTQVTP